MAFVEIVAGHKLPAGASERYRLMEGIERQLKGTFYDDLPYAWEEEKDRDGNHISTRKRRPSTDFNLAHEITQDTLGELFGDEQFPIIRTVINREKNEDAAKVVTDLIEAVDLAKVVSDAYEDGVVGSAAVVLYRSDDGSAFYKILPGKWCEPVYRSPVSTQLVALVVTYPIDREWVLENFPEVAEKEKAADTFWYRYIIGPFEEVDYLPLSDEKFAKLGEKEPSGEVIEFVQHRRTVHGFKGRAPFAYVKNLGGHARDIDGPALWWPVRNLCVTIDYGLSQLDRGLRYSADPMLFVRKGDLMDQDDTPAGYERPAGGMATNMDAGGAMVKGVTQTLVGGNGSDAKLLEISGQGLKEEREFVKDCRELALEIIGGQKASAEHTKGEQSGTALKRLSKPLRRVVRRQRRPYGNGLLLDLIDLTLYGLRLGTIVLPIDREVDFESIPDGARNVLEWPNDEEMTGTELLAHVTGVQLAVGGSAMNPKELILPEVMGAKLATDIGLHEQYDSIKGTLQPLTDPDQAVKIASMKPAPKPAKPKPAG